MKRLESLDILRGFDLFLLTVFCPLLHAFNATGSYSWLQPLMRQFDHTAWSGFTLWDLVMPLFMFMAGVSIPFAFAKYEKLNESNGKIYFRIAKRVVLLWILGMICQGNLLAFDTSTLKFYSNTLQSIAVGYLIASLFFLHTKPKTQIISAIAMLLIYWAAMTFVKINEYGGGDFSSQKNLAELIDRVVLGRWRDGASLAANGSVIFPEWYNYTWILSSINFAVTVMSGMFAGQILKSGKQEKSKIKILFFAGIAMVAIGWLWHLQMPVIKRLWTSSMVLVSSGYCFLLLAVFYYLIDFKKHRKGLQWFKIFGMNSIVAYMLSVEVSVVNFSSVSKSLFYGMQQFITPPYFNLLILTSNLAIVFALLYFMYRYKIFLKA